MRWKIVVKSEVDWKYKNLQGIAYYPGLRKCIIDIYFSKPTQGQITYHRGEEKKCSNKNKNWKIDKKQTTLERTPALVPHETQVI